MDTNKEVISKLKFIGKIKPHEKIDCKNLYIQNNNFFTKIIRYFSGYDRTQTLNFIENVIDKTISILDNSNKYEEEEMSKKNLLEDLKNSIQGIENLKQTYNTDRKFVCDLETIIEIINIKLVKYS